ncbi:DUF2934 domain-containing protein [Roseomonas sp. GCM10028921]
MPEDKRIRERAQGIWEKEGRPEGRDQEHWLQAERELGSEGGSPSSAAGDVAASTSGPAVLNPGDEAAPGTPGTGDGICPVCQGTGRTGGQACENCGGSGIVIQGVAGG